MLFLGTPYASYPNIWAYPGQNADTTYYFPTVDLATSVATTLEAGVPDVWTAAFVPTALEAFVINDLQLPLAHM